MGMEPINSISSIQAQTMTRPVTTPKVSNETVDGTAENVTVPKLDNNTVAVAKTQEGNGRQGYENQENAGQPNQESIRRAVENINKNLKKIALKSALAAKYEAYEIFVVEDLKMDEIKTATIAKMLKGIEIDSKALIVTAQCDENVYKSARNIKGVTPTYVDVLNTYEIIKHDKFVISKEAVAKIEEVLL